MWIESRRRITVQFPYAILWIGGRSVVTDKTLTRDLFVWIQLNLRSRTIKYSRRRMKDSRFQHFTTREG
jgi:hypothetical protein